MTNFLNFAAEALLTLNDKEMRSLHEEAFNAYAPNCSEEILSIFKGRDGLTNIRYCIVNGTTSPRLADSIERELIKTFGRDYQGEENANIVLYLLCVSGVHLNHYLDLFIDGGGYDHDRNVIIPAPIPMNGKSILDEIVEDIFGEPKESNCNHVWEMECGGDAESGPITYSYCTNCGKSDITFGM